MDPSTSESLPPSVVTSNEKYSDSKDIAQLKEQTMRLSIIEGSFWAIMQTFCDNYLIPYGIALNMTNPQIGVLNSMTGLIPSVGQITGSRLMEKKSRKTVLVSGVIMQALMLPLIILLGVLFLQNAFITLLPWLLILFYTGFTIFNAIGSPAWFSMMGDIVPNEWRGRYFSKRNLIASFIGLVATLVISYFLDAMNSLGLLLIGFFVIFLIAFGARMISALLLHKQYNPPFHVDRSDYVSLKQFLKEIPTTNFGHFALFVALMNFAQMIAGPYFTPYMIQDLNFDYSLLVIVNLSSAFIALFVYPILGKSADRFGNILMLRIGSLMVPFLPLLWIFLTNPVEIILGPQLIGGIGWTFFNMAAFNFIFDSVDTHKRGYYLAYYNFLVGLGVFFGGLVGSFILELIEITFMHPIKFIFLLSSIVRGVIVLIFLPKIKEVRSIEHVPHQPVFRFRSNIMNKNFIELNGFEHWYRKREKHPKKTHHWGLHWGFRHQK